MTVKHITKDGGEMLISEMDDGHLLNTIKWIERRAKEGVQRNVGFYDPFGAENYYDSYMLSFEEALEFLNYSSYVEEANKRGITNVL